MKPLSCMILAGEASGDHLAAQLVHSLRRRAVQRGNRPSSESQPRLTTLDVDFFGAGGPRMAGAGVQIEVDLTRLSVIGISDVLRKIMQFRRVFLHLVRLAERRQPDLIIGVDFSGFNRRFARAIKSRVRARSSVFRNWNPRFVQYVSPQVWASRPGRARAMEPDTDLVLSIFPFEPDWYRRHAPALPVTFVGHPIVERLQDPELRQAGEEAARHPSRCWVALLPGSRVGEIERHVPPLIQAARLMADQRPSTQFKMVLPEPDLARRVRSMVPVQRWLSEEERLDIQVGGLGPVLCQSRLALASTGTVTLECACLGVPTVAFYRTSWTTYSIGRCIIQVPYLAMPNLLAGECLFPEFVQHEVTGLNLARAGLELLDDEPRRLQIQRRLEEMRRSLGGPGASDRAAEAILKLLKN